MVINSCEHTCVMWGNFGSLLWEVICELNDFVSNCVQNECNHNAICKGDKRRVSKIFCFLIYLFTKASCQFAVLSNFYLPPYKYDT